MPSSSQPEHSGRLSATDARRSARKPGFRSRGDWLIVGLTPLRGGPGVCDRPAWGIQNRITPLHRGAAGGALLLQRCTASAGGLGRAYLKSPPRTRPHPGFIGGSASAAADHLQAVDTVATQSLVISH